MAYCNSCDNVLRENAKFLQFLSVVLGFLGLLVITGCVPPTNEERTIRRQAPSATPKNQLQVQEKIEPGFAGTPEIYRNTIPTCKALAEELAEEELIQRHFDQPTGFRRTCKKSHPNDLEFARELTMWVEEYPTEDDAHKFLEITRYMTNTVPLAVPWEPDPRLNVDEYVTWARHAYGLHLIAPGSAFYTEYRVAVRIGRTLFYVRFIELDDNIPYLGRLPGVMHGMLSNWSVQINHTEIPDHAEVSTPTPNLAPTPPVNIVPQDVPTLTILSTPTLTASQIFKLLDQGDISTEEAKALLSRQADVAKASEPTPAPTPMPTALPTATPRPEPTATPTPQPINRQSPYSGGLLTIAPACATLGTTLRVEASGLSPDSDYDITMDGIVLITAHTDKKGRFSTTAFLFKTPGGLKSVFAYGSKGKEAATTIGVTPTLSLASGTGLPGFRLFLAGNGYQANETVPIKFGDAIVGTASSDEFGDWSEDIIIPHVPAGTYPISVPGPCGPVQLSFRVTA